MNVYFKPGPNTRILHADEGVTILPPDEEQRPTIGYDVSWLLVPLAMWHQVQQQLLQQAETIRQQAEIIARQGAELQQLRDQAAKNSRNSSKPPASDGLRQPARTRSQRPRGQKPLGGQPGHRGDTLKSVAQPDHIIIHPVTECVHCHSSLVQVAVSGYDTRQVFDLPPLKLEVTEHQVERKLCPSCGQKNSAVFPPEVRQPTQYGPRLKAQAVYLTHYDLLSLERAAQFFADVYGQPVAEDTLRHASRHIAQQVVPVNQAVAEQLRQATVVNVDETGLRVAGKLHWLHVASTPTLTLYHIHPKRGKEGMVAGGVINQVSGRLVHDYLKSYYKVHSGQHALCNAHHLRDLTFIQEQYDQDWAGQLADLLRDIHRAVEQTRPFHDHLPSERIAEFEQRYTDLLVAGEQLNPPPERPPTGRRPKQTFARNLLDRLRDHRAEVLAFMYDFRVPFDNNQAERDLRMMKVKQKISGGFRTLTGAIEFAAVRSYISTMRKQGHPVLQALELAYRGTPIMPAPVL